MSILPRVNFAEAIAGAEPFLAEFFHQQYPRKAAFAKRQFPLE